MQQLLVEAQHASLASAAAEEDNMQPVKSAVSPSPSADSSGSDSQSDSDSDGSRDIIMPQINIKAPVAVQQKQMAVAAQKERRRRQILPKIAKEDRCGFCHHCRNPKLKKACITARNAQMKKLDDKEELPLFYKIAYKKLS